MRLVARTTKAVITAIIDTVSRDDHVNLQRPILIDAEGAKTINHTGETLFQYDSDEPLMVYGEALYVSEDGHAHLAGDLELQHPDGNTEPIEGAVQPQPIRPYRGEMRTLKALEYAQWILHSIHALNNQEIDQVTLDRVHARAREHAQAAGATDLLAAILHATQNDAAT